MIKSNSNLIIDPNTGDILIYSELFKGNKIIAPKDMLIGDKPMSGKIKDADGNWVSLVDKIVSGEMGTGGTGGVVTLPEKVTKTFTGYTFPNESDGYDKDKDIVKIIAKEEHSLDYLETHMLKPNLTDCIYSLENGYLTFIPTTISSYDNFIYLNSNTLHLRGIEISEFDQNLNISLYNGFFNGNLYTLKTNKLIVKKYNSTEEYPVLNEILFSENFVKFILVYDEYTLSKFKEVFYGITNEGKKIEIYRSSLEYSSISQTNARIGYFCEKDILGYGIRNVKIKEVVPTEYLDYKKNSFLETDFRIVDETENGLVSDISLVDDVLSFKSKASDCDATAGIELLGFSAGDEIYIEDANDLILSGIFKPVEEGNHSEFFGIFAYVCENKLYKSYDFSNHNILSNGDKPIIFKNNIIDLIIYFKVNLYGTISTFIKNGPKSAENGVFFNASLNGMTNLYIGKRRKTVDQDEVINIGKIYKINRTKKDRLIVAGKEISDQVATISERSIFSSRVFFDPVCPLDMRAGDFWVQTIE